MNNSKNENPNNEDCCGGNGCCGGGNKAAAQESACCGGGDSCDCHSSSSSSGKLRTIIGGVVVVAAALLVVRAIAKDSGSASTTEAQQQGFVMPVAATASTKAESVIGTEIDSFDALNRAAQTDAVFLLLADKNGQLPSDAVKGAAAKIEKQGQKCGLFTLKTSSPDFAQLTSQATLPAVLVMVKGKGTIWVSGDITEEKLVQGYVTASRVAGCCSGGGCSCQ